MDKDLIARRFLKANKSYDKFAIAQKIIHKKMLDILINVYGIYSFNDVLEIGCGSGCFTKLIENQFDIKNWTINDLVDYLDFENTFINKNYQSVKKLFGDAENMVFEDSFDLILSSCAIQWFNKPINFIKQVSKNLKKNGILLISTFGEKNLYEIKKITGIGLDYLDINEYKKELTDLNIVVEESEINIYFKHPYDVLKHIKNTGVNATSPESFHWNREKLKDFENKYYELFSTKDGNVKLTYHPIYIYTKII